MQQSMMKHGTEQKGGKNESICHSVVYHIIDTSHEHWRLGRISHYNYRICNSVLLLGRDGVK
jgi:hypothetical protein